MRDASLDVAYHDVIEPEVWIRLEALAATIELDEPVVMPRRFRRRRAAPVTLFDGVALEATAGDQVAIVGTDAEASAIGAIVAGVAAPASGSVCSSHPIVAVLRRRARPLVDQRVFDAIDRELRLRGVRVHSRSVLDEAARLVGVDPDGWTSELRRDQYSHLAPAAVACSDVPIILFEGVFTHRPNDFEDRLVERMAARSDGGLVTLVVLNNERVLGGALAALTLHRIHDLPGSDTLVGAEPEIIDDALGEDDDAADEEDATYAALDCYVEAPGLFEDMGLRLAVHDVMVTQPESGARHILGTMPFRVEVEIEAAVTGSAWRVLLADSSTGVVMCSVVAQDAPAGRNVLVVDLPAGLPIGRHWVLVQGSAYDVAGAHVFGGRPVATITCKRTVDEPRSHLEATASWRT